MQIMNLCEKLKVGMAELPRCSDMPSAEIKYHRNCYSQFLLCDRKVGVTENKAGRAECQIKYI